MLSFPKTQSPDVYAYWTLGFLFLIGFQYFQSHPSGDGLQLSFNTFAWIPISIFIGLSLFSIVRKSRFLFSDLTLGLAASVVLLLVPALFPNSLDITTIGRFYGLIGGVLILVGLQQLDLTNEKRTGLLLIVVIGIAIQAIVGWCQHFGLVPEGFMGYSAENKTPWGIFRQPNVMASLMATGLVFSAYILPNCKSFNVVCQKGLASFCLLVPLLTIPLIMLLNSRVGWLGALIGSLLMIPFLYKEMGRRITLGWIAMILLAITVGLFLLSISDGGFGRAASKIEVDPIRLKMYPVAISLALDHVFTGTGYGSFEASFNAFAAGLYASGDAEPSGVTNLHHPHNELLFWSVEGGIIALGGLLFAAYFVLRTILRSEKGVRLALVGLFLPIVLHTQTEYPFYHSVIHWVLFVLIIYIADTHGNKIRSRQLKSTIIVGTTAIVIPLITSVFMATTLHASAVLDRYEREPGTSPDVLLSIVNPIVWRDRLIFTLRGNLMMAGLSRGDTSEVQPFIDLLIESINSRPRWERYQDLIIAYEFLNNFELAEQTFQEAEHRFPTVNFYRLNENTFRILTYPVTVAESAVQKTE